MISVIEFREKTLFDALTEIPRNDALVIKNPRIRFLSDYLSTIGAHTMVIEDGYIDRNYLEDYAAYYVRCHADYDRKCRRIHFFSKSFDKNQFVSACLGETNSVHKELGEYLGFVIVKPLPQSFIGRTCLHVYPASKRSGSRHYKATAMQEAHVLGRTFTVKTMPFQEQDSVVAACATTALWSALQTIGPLFGLYTPTPSEITAQSAGHPMKLGRDLPSSGLSLYQMMQAIIRHGYEPEARELVSDKNEYMKKLDLDPNAYLAELVHGYNSAGLPVILGHQIQCSQCQWIGFHAATISGYSVKGNTRFGLATRIDEFYAHDDQAGPFSRLLIRNGSILETEFPHSHGRDQSSFAIPLVVVVPAYPKIRITYEEARSESHKITAWLAGLDISINSETTLRHAHDVYSRIGRSSHLPPAVRERVIDDSPPRFLWTTMWYIGDESILEVLMDATNIRPSFFCYRIIIHSESLGKALLEQFDDVPSTAGLIPSAYQSRWMDKIQEAILDWS